MPTYAQLVEHDLVQKIREDLARWSDGQILEAPEERVVEIMVDRYSYKPVEFVYGSERREQLVPGEPAAGVRIHFKLKPGGQNIPDFMALQASHHRGERPLKFDQYSVSFEVNPMGSAEQVQQMLDAVRSNIEARNRNIEQGGPKLLVHAQNIYRERRAEAETNQAAGQRAMDELNKLGIPDLEEPGTGQAETAADTDVRGSLIGGDAIEVDPPRQAAAVSRSLTYAVAAPVVQELDPHLEKIQELVETLLDRAHDDFTRSICSQILEEVSEIVRFTTSFDGSLAATEVVDIPQSFFNSTRVFDWIASAITSKGIDFLDDLGGELLEASDLVGRLLELAANPPV